VKDYDSSLLLSFAENLKKLRKQKKFSQEELANLAGMHRTYIGMIERSEKNITLINIGKLASALDVEIEELFKK
jgi:transcriptional regulator with XRE-family HTH domain